MAGLTLRALGGFELSLGDRAIALPRKKSRALLTYLALHHDQEQSREKIAGLLWGNSGEEQARASLRQTLTDLRRALPPEDTDGLVIDGEAFALDSSAADVDAIRFHAALAEDGPDALELAVALYRGELLEGFSLREPGFQEWLERERAHLRGLVMDALGKLLRYYERTGARDAAISTANRLLAFDSLQEDVHRSLMRLYVAQGRRSLALQQYERCRAVLREELEVDPADETASLYEDVREHRDLASAGAPGSVPEPERKLAVILAADVAGYSRLMSGDEEDTLHRLRNHREVIDGLVVAHNGRVFGSAGDSVIAEFASPVSAVKCAIEIQTKLDAHESELPETRRIRFRIGVNLGDVMIEGDNLMGDGVNVAARLEALAPPGGLYVSDSVVAQVRERVADGFVDLGEHRVKNIQRPVRVYRLPLASEAPLVSPFRGLSAFEFEHAKLFFGRARAVAAIKERLERQAATGTAFLLIYGMSGAGKSSLLRAGLLPALMESGAVSGIDEWRWCVIRPSEAGRPVEALVNGLLEALPELAADTSPPDLVRLLVEAPARALNPLRRALARAAGNSRQDQQIQPRLIVAVDQTEELFAGSVDGPARTAFVQALGTLARSGIVWVIATLRADFFHRCAEIPELSVLKDGFGSYELLPPSGTEIAQIIREPAAAVGIRYEEDPDAGRLEDELQQAAVKDPASLPLLEFLLDRLFEAGKARRLMKFADYRALGGLEGAISRRADEVAAALEVEVQDALPTVLWALTTVHLRDETVGGRTAPYAEVAGTPAQARLVDALTDARLLVSDEDAAGNTVVRLAHESLLSYWPRASAIISESRAFLETRARLQTDTRRWLSDDKNPDLLLPHGKRLAEAQELMEWRQGELNPNLVDYVAASNAAEETRLRAVHEAERRQLQAEAERQRLAAERQRLAAAAAVEREQAARRLARRTRLAGAATVVLAVLAGIGAVVGLTGQQEATRQAEIAQQRAADAQSAETEAAKQAQAALAARDDALVAESRAIAARKEAVSTRNQALRDQSLYLADLSRQQTASGNATLGMLLAMEALPENPLEPDRPYVIDAERALYQGIYAQRELAVLDDHVSAVTRAAFSPDGTKLATGSVDKSVLIWDTGSQTKIATLTGHEGSIRSVAFSPDGRFVLTASADKTARIWEAATGRELSVLSGHDGQVLRAIFSPDGATIATASRDRSARIWDKASGRTLAVLEGHAGPIADLAFSPNGETIVTASWDGTGRIWRVDTGEELATLEGHEDRLVSVSYDATGERIITASDDKTARLWDAVSGEGIHVLRGHAGEVASARFSFDSGSIVTASADGTARVWDTASGAELGILRGHTDKVSFAVFGPDDRQLLTTSNDGTARLWRHEDMSQLIVLRGHEDTVLLSAFAPDGRHAVTVSRDGTARIWDTRQEVGALDLVGHRDSVSHVRFSPDGRLIATASADGTARLWNAITGDEVAILEGHMAQLRQVEFSPDGTRLVTASQDGTARIWDVATAEEVAVLEGHTDMVFHAEFSPDGKTIATGSLDQTARIWDAQTGALRVVLDGNKGPVRHAKFSPVGDRVVTSYTDGDTMARIWDIGSGEQIAALPNAAGFVLYAEFSPDGRLLVSSAGISAGNGAARLWDVETGQLLHELCCQEGGIRYTGFAPSGDRIFTMSFDGSIRMWEATKGAEIASIQLPPETRFHYAVLSPRGDHILGVSSDDKARLWVASTGAELALLEGHTDTVLHAAFSPDGRRVATASRDGRVRIFDVFPSTRELIDYAKERVPRQLTPCERRRFFVPTDTGDACR